MLPHRLHHLHRAATRSEHEFYQVLEAVLCHELMHLAELELANYALKIDIINSKRCSIMTADWRKKLNLLKRVYM